MTRELARRQPHKPTLPSPARKTGERGRTRPKDATGANATRKTRLRRGETAKTSAESPSFGISACPKKKLDGNAVMW